MTPTALARLRSACKWQELPQDTKNPDKISFVTPPARLTFAWLEKPKPFPQGPRTNAKTGKVSEGKYQACLILCPDEDLALFAGIVGRIAAPAFGANFAQNSKLIYPYKPQADCRVKATGERFKGMNDTGYYLSADSAFPVKVWDSTHSAVLDCTREKGHVYSGMWVRAVLRAYAYKPTDPQAKWGVGLGLMELQKLADDEEFRDPNAGSKLGAVDGIEPHKAPAAMPGLAGLPGV